MPFGSLIGGAIGAFVSEENRRQQWDMNELNYKRAKEFAQNSMKWKAQDLRDSGINPIYAMGAGGYSAPVGVAPQYDISSFEKIGEGIGRIPQFIKEQKELSKAQASKIRSEANLNNAKAVRELNQDNIVGASGQNLELSPVTGKIFTHDVRNGWNNVIDSQHLTEAKENDFILWLSDMLQTVRGVDDTYRSNLRNSLIANGEYNPARGDVLDIDWFGGYKVYPKGQAPDRLSTGSSVDELKHKLKKAYGKMEKSAPKGWFNRLEWMLKQMGF